MRILVVVFLLTAIFPVRAQYGWNEQVELVPQVTNNYSLYSHSPVFDDRYNQAGHYTFADGKALFYRDNMVKRVSVYDTLGKLQYFADYEIDGKLIQTGRQLGVYFTRNKSVIIEGMKYYDVTEYWRNDLLMKTDTMFSDYKTYEVADTNFAYGINEQIVYMRGCLINEQNRYLNEKYGGKYAVQQAGVFYSYSHPVEPYLYFEEKLKTDYDSLTLYKVKRIRGVSGVHHYVGENQQEWEQVMNHPFFQPTSDISFQEYFTDAAGFCEPTAMYQRMWCGNSLYQNYYHDDGLRFVYHKNIIGLTDTLYLDFYPEDPNPPKPKESTEANPNALILVNPGYRIPVARLETPIRRVELVYVYEFWD